MPPGLADSRRWRAAAEAAGVTDLVELKTVLGWVAGIRGRCGSLTVDLAFADGGWGWAPSIRVGGLLPGLSLHRERPSRAPSRGAAAGLDTEIGDGLFDREVEVHGPDVPLRALLDVETRGAVRRLLAGAVDAAPGIPRVAFWIAVAIGGGELRAVPSEEARSATHESLANALRTLLDLGRRLVRPEDIPARLARNAGSDPEWGVRLRNLQALIRDFPEDPATREALQAACGDQSEAIRLRAALALPGRGHGVLLAIATAEHSDDARAAQAVAALGRELPRARALETLGSALRRRRLCSAHACIAWLGRHGQSDGVETLARVLAIEQGELAVAAARALGETRLPEAEAPLVEALGRDVQGLGMAAAEALGEVGSAAAVWPLQKAARRAGDEALERAIQRAVAAIQSRLSGSPGQLSLAGGEAGQLALAEEDPAGQVSLAPSEPPESDG